METTTRFINEIAIKYTRRTFTNTSIKNSLEASHFIREVYNTTESEIELKEYFFILLLNRANKVIGYHKLSEGGICGTVVDVRLVFATALKSLATGIIITHNHPSGNKKPSEQDHAITKQIVQAGKLLDIQLLDHIIITDDDYYSFADNGQL